MLLFLHKSFIYLATICPISPHKFTIEFPHVYRLNWRLGGGVVTINIICPITMNMCVVVNALISS